MGAACELCQQKLFLSGPPSNSAMPPEDVETMHKIRAHLYDREGAIILCTDHAEDCEKLGYDLSKSGVHTRANRRKRRADKATNLTRAQRKAT